MGKLQHIYVTAHGEFTSAPWLGEFGQIGLRMTVEPALEEPARGSVYTPYADHGDITLKNESSVGTHGTLLQSWEARLGPVGSLDNADAAFQKDLAEDFWTFLDTIRQWQHAQWRWTHIKIAGVQSDGKSATGSSVYNFSAPVVGVQTGAFALPPEVALAVSLRAGILGRRGRGRMYIPALATPMVDMTTGVTSGTNGPTMATALKTLVTNLEDAPGIENYGPVVCVMSAGSLTAVRPTEARVGTHLDVQRRRQAQTKEGYYASAL